MGVESHFSSKALGRLAISILIIIFLDGWVASASLEYRSCGLGKCDVMKGYCFWNDTKPCTDASLHNECHDRPVLHLQPSRKDVVQYGNRLLRLSSELGIQGEACFGPTEQSPVPPSKSPTDVSESNREPPHLAFLSCTSFPSDDYPYPDSTRPFVGPNDTYAALVVKPLDLANLNWSVCKSNVTVRVVILAGEDGEKKKNVELLKHGFALKWDSTFWESCVACKKSGGNCRDGQPFRCHCPDEKEEQRTCKRGNNNAPLWIGLGSGFGALASIFLCSCIYVIHRRRRHSFLIFRSRHSSSNSSSKEDLEEGNVYFEVPIFTNTELEEATNHFDAARELGDGGFGTVYYGKLRDGREVAVKRLYEHNYRRVKQFMTEVQILTRLHHKNLVSLYGCSSQRSRELLLVYEYIPNGTVADHLHGERAQQEPLLWPTRISIAIETAAALAYLHASDIIHRDVKTNNILLDKNFSVKVADFGLSRLFPNDVSHVSTAPQGTPGYVDPEYHQCYQLTEKSDVYSFGVVLVELVSSMPAVDISRDRHEINLANLATSKIRNRAFCELIDPNLGFESDPEINRMIMAVAELAFGCLQQDKDMRPSMKTVLEELKAISRGTHEPSESKDVSDNISTGQSKNPPPSPECEDAGLLKNVKSAASPVSVTQKWGSSGSSSVHSG